MNGANAVSLLLDRRITVDHTDFAVTVHEHDARAVYLPLARRIVDESTNINSQRFMVGIAGPPGAGKSVTAAILARAIEIVKPTLGAQVVPLDGFHYPNSELERRMTQLPDGSTISLRSIKGHQRTFNVERVVQTVQRLRDGEIVSLPIYSRIAHDPVENTLSIDESCRVVIVEGNYLYLEENSWGKLQKLFDMRVFVTASTEMLHRNLRERHVRGGRTTEEAKEQIQTVDAPNIETVQSTAVVADISIEGERGSLVFQSTQ